MNSQKSSKKEKYESLLKRAKLLLLSSDHQLSKMANATALIKKEFKFSWVGFYLKHESRDELYLGPFQGETACTAIPFHRGVCGKAFRDRCTIIVDNVDEFEGHIACSSDSKSEIVVPLFTGPEVVAVLDVDSIFIASFDDIDRIYLEKLVHLVL